MSDKYDKLTDREVIACCNKLLYDAQLILHGVACNSDGLAMPIGRVVEVATLVDGAVAGLVTVLGRGPKQFAVGNE